MVPSHGRIPFEEELVKVLEPDYNFRREGVGLTTFLSTFSMCHVEVLLIENGITA